MLIFLLILGNRALVYILPNVKRNKIDVENTLKYHDYENLLDINAIQKHLKPVLETLQFLAKKFHLCARLRRKTENR